MILQSREQRERADVAASLSGMEMALREKEMGSMALDRKERRRLQEMQITQDKERFALEREENFQKKLTKIQANELNNLHQGAATMFDTMFSTLFRNNTAGGELFKEGNYNSLVKDLKGKEYGFTPLESKRIAGAIMSYGVGKDKPNALAMAELARYMKEKSSDKQFMTALVRGGMVADPTTSPESAKSWLANMEGMTRTQANIYSLRKEWQDFADDDPENDLTMRPLTGIYDFLTTAGKGGGTGGGGGYNISANLMQLQAEAEAIAAFEKERDVIGSNTSLTQGERDKALDRLKYEAITKDGKKVPTSYQKTMQRYDVAKDYFGGGAQEDGLMGQNIYMTTDIYALKDPEGAVDAIADHRDQLGIEKKDAIATIQKNQRIVDLSKSVAYDKLSDTKKIEVETAKVEVFRETERLSSINDAIHKFYLEADIETEKYIGMSDFWSGDPTGAKRFRRGSAFPYELLTRSEQDRIREQQRMDKGMRNVRQGGMSGRLL